MPEHIHFLWTLPPNDSAYSQRVGRLKVFFTQSKQHDRSLPDNISNSRRKHRESNIWQRRFWEHTISDEEDLEQHLEYIHYNPVKHGLVSCPHLWSYSSFSTWVRKGVYDVDWCCTCNGRQPQQLNFDAIANKVGE